MHSYSYLRNDIIVTSNSSTAISQLISNLSCEPVVKGLGSLSFFSGIQVMCNVDILHLHQEKYEIDLLHCIKMVNAKPTPTPCYSSGKLSKFL